MKWKGLASVALFSGLVLSACSSDSSSSNDTNVEEVDTSYTVGVTQIVEHPSLDAAYDGFKQALEDAGLDVEFDVEYAQGDPKNNPVIADKFVGDNVDLIFANSTGSAQSALQATDTIPIVFTSVTDPVGAELVTSMEEAGPNITGTTDTHPDAIPNTVKFMAEEVGVKSVGVIYNSGEQNSVVQIDKVKEAASEVGVEVKEAVVSTSAEVKQAAESLLGNIDAYYIVTDNTVVTALESVLMVGENEDIPVFVGELDSVERGGFAAYGFDYYDIGYEAGEKAIAILTGEKEPSELPVTYPGQLKLQINKTAAENMGVTLKDNWEDLAEFIE